MAFHLRLESDEIAAVMRKNRIEGLINSTGLTGQAGANYQALQAAIKERKQLELMGWHELCETQRLRHIQTRRRLAKERQKALELAKSAATRRRNKDIQRLDFQPPSTDYYEGKLVAPGLLFLKALADVAAKREVRVNVPNTLLFYNGYTWLGSENGVVRTRKDFKVGEFFACFRQPGNTSEPVAVLRPTNDRGEGSRIALLSCFELAELMQKNSFPTYGLLQQAVLLSGKRTATLRLFHRKTMPCTAISYRHLNLKSIISTDVKEEEVEITSLGGHSVSQLKAEGDQVVVSLERGLGLRISLLVLDMIKDAEGTLWLISCKGILFEEGSAAPAAEAREEQLCAMHCSLCLIPHQRFEMTHSLPFRLLMLYKNHVDLAGRKLLDLSHIRVNSMDFLSHSVSVCPLCYMLVTTEYELIQAEAHLGLMLHIPPDHHSLTEQKLVLQPNFMPPVMQRWRVLLYIDEINTEVSLTRPFIHYSLFGRNLSYRLEPTKTDNSLYSLSFACMRYFFVPSDTSLKSICHPLLLPVLLTRTEDKDNLIGQGEIRPFQPFTFQLQENEALCQPMDVLLFSETVQTAKMRLWVGLVCDKPVAVRSLPVSIERFGGLYIPEENYKTADLLPEVWMELFDDKKELERTKIQSSTEEIQTMYTPSVKTKDFLAFSQGLEHVLHIGVNLDPLYHLKRKRTSRPRLLRTQSQAFTLPHSCASPPSNIGYSQVQSPVYSPVSGHEDTLQDLEAFSPSQSQDLLSAASDFLLKRTSSATTRKLLSQAHSVVANAAETTPKQVEETTLPVGGAVSTIELIPRPKTATTRPVHLRSASQGTIEKSQRIYGRKFTHA